MSAVLQAPTQGDLGTNCQYRIVNGILTLTIDLNARHGESSSGKSVIVATTSGNKEVPGTAVTIGINAYVKK